MNYTYKNKELAYIRQLKSAAPHNIWWNFTSYVFDYGTFYYQLTSSPQTASSQNPSDEAIMGELTKQDQTFVPNDQTVLVCAHQAIEEIMIVRVLLHFTDFKRYSKASIIFKRIKLRFNKLIRKKTDPIEQLITTSIGEGQELLCHPASEEAKKVNPDFSNLIDCGLILKIDGKYMKAFVEQNGFGFPVWNDQFFVESAELKEIADIYELIAV